MDLTPLIKDSTMVIGDYVAEYIDRFKADVLSRINKAIR
jgi:hypothetical protein